jgi:hypothetical protein
MLRRMQCLRLQSSALRQPRTRALNTPSAPAVLTDVQSGATTVEAATRAYRSLKYGVVWLVKQLDSHLCDLDRRIEAHIASRAKARAEGDFEKIAQAQNRLGELCIEHKQRLDSMLFFWILGGFASVAGWVRATAAQRGGAPASGASTLAAPTVQAHGSSVAAEVEAGVRAALLTLPSSAPPPPPSAPPSAPPPPNAGSGGAERELLTLQQCTCVAAVGSCLLSAAALIVACRSR